MILGTVTSTEQYRGELAGLDVLMLAADRDVPDHQAAKVALGLEPETEPDGPGPSCGYCGRTAPADGLEDQSLNGPPVHECTDSADCQSARQAAEPVWIDRQFRSWPIDLHKLQEIQAYQAQQAAKSRWGGGIYQLSADVDDPEFILALGHVRDLVDQKAAGYLESWERVGEKALALAAGTHDPAPQAEPAQAPPEPVKFPTGWEHVLGQNRAHTFGGQLEARFGPAPPPAAQPAPLAAVAGHDGYPGISAWCAD